MFNIVMKAMTLFFMTSDNNCISCTVLIFEICVMSISVEGKIFLILSYLQQAVILK